MDLYSCHVHFELLRHFSFSSSSPPYDPLLSVRGGVHTITRPRLYSFLIRIVRLKKKRVEKKTWTIHRLLLWSYTVVHSGEGWEGFFLFSTLDVEKETITLFLKNNRVFLRGYFSNLLIFILVGVGSNGPLFYYSTCELPKLSRLLLLQRKEKHFDPTYLVNLTFSPRTFTVCLRKLVDLFLVYYYAPCLP